MPRHYSCFKDIIPAQDMVSREGALNLARYLPKYFCIPDLGPKMYIAYGWLEEFIGTNRKELYEKMRQVNSSLGTSSVSLFGAKIFNSNMFLYSKYKKCAFYSQGHSKYYGNVLTLGHELMT